MRSSGVTAMGVLAWVILVSDASALYAAEQTLVLQKHINRGPTTRTCRS